MLYRQQLLGGKMALYTHSALRNQCCHVTMKTTLWEAEGGREKDRERRGLCGRDKGRERRGVCAFVMTGPLYVQ